eukprot:TRINITY_DN7922_c0_g3_i1.p1 TRINITY_DN7922_c0_g3~~TRINITY_DN7922_c0_g3_i1.p1  ORF type:complete len:417 (+),score=79.47 TRINITY_DN7922_c0_g3_i1:75-1325(+)
MFFQEDRNDFATFVLTLVVSSLATVGLAKVSWKAARWSWSSIFWTNGSKSSLTERSKPTSAALPDGEHLGEHDYWSKGYGQYKYCGLREDPFASTQQPQPCRRPDDILLPPDLDPDVKKKILVLAERVTDLKEAGFRTDPSTLLRYLRARKFDLVAAEKQLREAVAWRQKHNLETVFTHWNLEAFHDCLGPWYHSGGILGHGKNGQPIAYERLGRANFPKLAASMPFELLLKCDMVHSLHCVAALEEDSIRRRVPLKGVIVVMDLEGFTFDQVQYSAARKLAKLVESRNLLLTEFTAKVLAVNAPSAAAKCWSMFSYLLDPGTVAKVEVVSRKDTFKALRVHVDDAEIPAFLGGEKHVNGDPECRDILAPGGLPPPDVLARFEVLARMEKDGTKVKSHPGDKQQIKGMWGCCYGSR